eukprot:6168176-Amphidinium_carterae.1
MVNEYTSLIVHKDRNLGTLWICALGDFTGGRLWQADEQSGVKRHYIDIRHHWHELDGIQSPFLGEIVKTRLEDVEVLVLSCVQLSEHAMELRKQRGMKRTDVKVLRKHVQNLKQVWEPVEQRREPKPWRLLQIL